MKIGYAKEIITPPFPVYLAGYAGKRLAEEAHDDLYVKVILIKLREEVYGIISYDLIGIDHLLTGRLDPELRTLGLNPGNFLAAATHTHSGPAGILKTSEGLLKGTDYIFGTENSELIESIVHRTIQAVKDALKSCREGRIRIARGSISGVGKNRNDSSRKGNEDILAAELQSRDHAPVLLVHYACHPTVLNHENLKLSADFPGALDEIMSRKGYAFTLYLNGSCGDISTRFTRQGKGFPEAGRYGCLLAEKTEQLLKEAREIQIEKIETGSLTAVLKLKKPEDPQKAAEHLQICRDNLGRALEEGIQGAELRLLKAQLEGAQANLNYAGYGPEQESQPVTVSLWQINQDIFAGIPGELFSELSNPLQNGRIHFAGYAGGYLGYFADKAAYDSLNYEALSSPFERGQAEILMGEIEKAVKTGISGTGSERCGTDSYI